jgi:glycosyltransferase involved in cell wall biosynthesis
LNNKKNVILSVVIASVNGLPIIDDCLGSLFKQEKTAELEVIVVARCPKEVIASICEKYSNVKLIEAPSRTSIPQLRALGFRESSGDIVAVLEDHCLVASDWAQRVIETHRFRYPVIGGSVENAAHQRIVDWAAFFCEYYRAMKPIPEGEVDFVPGNNVSYKKEILERFRDDFGAGIWDFELHERLKKVHVPLYLRPTILVYHKMSGSLGWFLIQKFYFARSLAGMRNKNKSWNVRCVYATGALILPMILFARISRTIWKKGMHRTEFLLSIPFLLPMLITWGIGEAVGNIFGAGSSTIKVA